MSPTAIYWLCLWGGAITVALGALCVMGAVLTMIPIGSAGPQEKRERVHLIVGVLVCAGVSAALLSHGVSMRIPDESASINAARSLAKGGNYARAPKGPEAALKDIKFVAKRLNAQDSTGRFVQSVTVAGTYQYNVIGNDDATNTKTACVMYSPTSTKWSYHRNSCSK